MIFVFIFGFLCWSSEKYRTAMCYDGSCFSAILNLFRNKVSRFDSLEFMSNLLNFVGALPFGFIWWKIEDRDFWIWKLWAILRKVQRRKASILMDGWGLSNHAEYFFEVVLLWHPKQYFSNYLLKGLWNMFGLKDSNIAGWNTLINTFLCQLCIMIHDWFHRIVGSKSFEG